MAIKEAKIRINTPGITEKIVEIPFFYTDEFKETSLYDFAFSSVIGDWLPYLFVGYFSDGKYFNKWYFSNARKHEEMREGIEQDLGTGYSYTWGQIWFGRVREEPLQFESLILHSDIPDRKKALELLLGAIAPRWLSEDFHIGLADKGNIWRPLDRTQTTELKY